MNREDTEITERKGEVKNAEGTQRQAQSDAERKNAGRTRRYGGGGVVVGGSRNVSMAATTGRVCRMKNLCPPRNVSIREEAMPACIASASG